MIVRFVLLLLVINPLDAKETAGCIIAASKPKPRILNVNLKSGRRPDVSAGYRYRSDDWLGNFISIPRSFVLKRVVFHLSSNVVVCSTVILLHQRGLIGTLAPLAHTLLGGFLGLLLIFRTNSAYARFWEARSLWGKVTTTSRKLALEVAAYLHPVSPPVADRLVRLLAAFPTALAQQCLGDRRDSDSSPEAAQNEAEMNELVGASPLSPPMELCLQMHRLLARDHLVAPRGSPAHGSMTFALRCARLAELIDELNDALGGCQRIVRTPVPLAYSRHTSRFLTMWCGTLPFALVGSLGVATLPVVTIACWALFGIEELGHLIEQPFVPHTSSRVVRAAGERPETIFWRGPETYDFSIPVETLAASVRADVWAVASSMRGEAVGA